VVKHLVELVLYVRVVGVQPAKLKEAIDLIQLVTTVRDTQTLLQRSQESETELESGLEHRAFTEVVPGRQLEGVDIAHVLQSEIQRLLEDGAVVVGEEMSTSNTSTDNACTTSVVE